LVYIRSGRRPDPESSNPKGFEVGICTEPTAPKLAFTRANPAAIVVADLIFDSRRGHEFAGRSWVTALGVATFRSVSADAMVSALLLALSETFDPRFRRTLTVSLLLTAAVLLALGTALMLILDHTSFFDGWFLNRTIEVLGGIAILGLTWLLFPAVATFVLSFFLDGVISASEARRHPGIPPARRQSVGEIVRGGARLAGLAIVLNLVALPLYLLVPGLNFVLFYVINGWLLGREYFEMVAQRRLDPGQCRRMWRAEWLRLVLGGMVIAFLLTVPLVNLAAPLIAALFMSHLFERLGVRYRSTPIAV
jgi:CysZ protein